MKPTSPRKISTSLAIESLREASERVWDLEDQLAIARAERDDLIRDASEFLTTSRISRVTKLSRQTIYKISPGRLDDDE